MARNWSPYIIIVDPRVNRFVHHLGHSGGGPIGACWRGECASTRPELVDLDTLVPCNCGEHLLLWLLPEGAYL